MLQSSLIELDVTESVDMQLSLEILKEIGSSEGRNSKVWLVKDIQLNEVLVLKGVLKSSFDTSEINQYYLETQIINDCKSPNIIPVRYAGMDSDYIYMILPYCKEGSIKSICENNFLTMREVVTYALEFLNGLLFLHTKNVLHLDIKPTNILIDNSGKAVITDFGLSKYLNDEGIVIQDKIYGPHIVPDMYFDNGRTVSIDIYNVGLTLYRMVNGEKEFENQLDQLKNNFAPNSEFLKEIKPYIVEGEFPNRNKYLPHVPKKMQKIINKALNVDPEQRYINVLDMLNDLSKLSDFLDWKMEINTNYYTWSYVDGKMNYTIKLIDKGKFILEGFKNNLETNRSQRITRFFKEYSTREEAFNDLSKLLKDSP